MSSVILEGRDLEKTYNMGDRGLKVLRGVSIEVREHEILAIQGPSGAGKSTLLHLLGLLDEPEAGRIFYREVDILACAPSERARCRNERIGFVFQFYHLFPDLTALENVCLPKMVGCSWVEYRAKRATIEARARRLLEMVGLAERMVHRPSELSGGERQRVAIARALMNEPEVLLCDEPTGNLDQKTAGEILDLLWRLNRETGQTFVIVTHDEGLARRAHRVVRMVDGVLSDGGSARPRGETDTKFRLRGAEPRGGYRRSPAVMGALAAGLPVLLSVAAAMVEPLAEAARELLRDPLGRIVAGMGLEVFLYWWLYALNERFRRATGRGYTGFLSVFGNFVPLMNLVWPFLVHTAPLGEAHRLLLANGEPGLRGRLIPALLWPAAWFGALAVVIASPDPGWRAFGAVSSLGLLGIAVAWIQSLHNTFYDRMQR